MKKKRFSLALAICLLLIFAVSGTMAFFTKEETATNVVTTGKIDISLLEIMVNPETGKEETVSGGFSVSGVMPGQAVTKKVFVKNEQYAQDAWIRINITKAVTLRNGAEGKRDILEIEFNTADWTEREEDGIIWYYYNKPLGKDEQTTPLMEAVTFSAQAGNEYQNSQAEIFVYAQAVQVKNNGTTALDATGWPAVPGEE